MHKFDYADIYLENLFKVVTKNALLITHIDYLYFPTMYYQHVENQRKDVAILDFPLLKRTWYIDMLKVHNPELIKSSTVKVESFINAVEPFERGRPFNANFIEQNYVDMINSFIDKTLKNGKDVYFTYIPSKEYLRDYNLESVLGAYRLIRNDSTMEINYGDLELDQFRSVFSKDQVLLKYFSNYYGELLFYRAVQLENLGRNDEAFVLFQRCLEFQLINNRMLQYAVKILKDRNKSLK